MPFGARRNPCRDPSSPSITSAYCLLYYTRFSTAKASVLCNTYASSFIQNWGGSMVPGVKTIQSEVCFSMTL